ncbi:hypothetical protein SAMN04489762_1445 [Terribacillus saccharophilus]|uniref:Uncharacterized protein n=1 Tax=Terribacillus saccharophilus TaxID=361277 RepID=A0AAX2EEA5_9BACI|nr:hypothetical protein SAMN04489762_1445 [Terribacillus saccharophilus]
METFMTVLSVFVVGGLLLLRGYAMSYRRKNRRDRDGEE